MTAHFRRRAAAAGFPYAHMAFSPSGFHVAILSARALVVHEVDVTNFSRAALVVDAGGVRWVALHLHAQSAVQRRAEATHVAEIVSSYSKAGLPVVVLGDFNSLSPRDAECHRTGFTVARLVAGSGDKERGAALAEKFLCRSDDAGCAGQAVVVKSNLWAIDYTPLTTLAAVGLFDLLAAHDNANHCPASYPTAAVAAAAGAGIDGHDDNGGVPLRIDFALANRAFLRLFPQTKCAVGGAALDFARDGSARGFFDATTQEKALLHEMVAASDHLPLVCDTAE